MAACTTLWLSGWDAACEGDLASNGVAFTGATEAATLAALATGALAPDATSATTGATLDTDAVIAGAEKTGPAEPTGLTGPLEKPPPP
ncbi:MAG: hypothetical protein ACRDR6_01715 [Pseudonocardiaceae bacterium]